MTNAQTIRKEVHVGDNGILNLQVAAGLPSGEYEVTVRLEPLRANEERQEDWRRYVLESYGAITDPSFFRHEQGRLETRDELP